MRRPLFCLLCLATLASCSGKKKPAADQAEQASRCEDNSDCEESEVCLDGACASTAPGAIYSDPQNAVTPDKVKAEVERINKAAEDRADKELEGL